VTGSRGIPRWLRITGAVAAVLLLVAFVGFRVMNTVIIEHYSRGWHATSSASAATRGILRGRPVIVPGDLVYERRPLHITDAWFEQATHIDHRWYLFRHEVVDPRYRLVLLADRRAGGRDVDCNDSLAHGADSTEFGTGGDAFFDDRVMPPFPDTLHVSVIHRSGC
jgi:hypothetical protein